MRTLRVVTAVVVTVAAVFAVGTAGGGIAEDVYIVQDLVSDTSGSALGTDASLVNGWGLSAGPTTPWWVRTTAPTRRRSTTAAARSRRSPSRCPAAPTGTVFNGGATDFVVSRTARAASARFLFATEGGQILGWSPTVNGTARVPAPTRRRAARSTRAWRPRPTGSTRPTSTTAASTCSTRVQARRASRSRTRSCRRATRRSGSRRSATSIFVTYAKQDAAKKDDVAGRRPGYVDQFTSTDSSSRASRAAAARTPAERAVGPRDGAGRASASSAAISWSATSATGASARTRIAAAANGSTRASFATATRRSITIDGLWAIAFGNGAAAGPDDVALLRGRPGRRNPRALRLDRSRLN